MTVAKTAAAVSRTRARASMFGVLLLREMLILMVNNCEKIFNR